MSGISKSSTLILILSIAISSLTLIAIKPASAQTIPKPSVPEFTVQYADNSYSIPADTSIDPFTGKTVINQAQYITNQTVQVTIKNQTIPSSAYLFYEIRMKGHYSQDWANISSIQANTHSEYTVLLYGIDGNNASSYFTSRLDEISSGGTVDFQVQAQVWHYEQSKDIFGSWNQVLWAASDWSNTQTITIGQTSPTSPAIPTITSISSSPTPAVPELTYCTLLIVLIFVIITAATLVSKKVNCFV
jgi:hypothetical protein